MSNIFKDKNIAIITGKTDEDSNDLAKKSFKFNQDTPVLIGTEAIQTGVNLQVADNVIHFDLPKSQDGVLQRRGRARRVGSKHQIIKEYFLLTKDSIDEVRFKNLKRQKLMSDGILDANSAQRKIIKELSNQ